MQNPIFFLLLTFLFCTHLRSLNAQRFEGGVVGGLNLSELAGEEISSYIGLNTGLIVKAKLKDHMRLSTEILFSQAGEYITPVFFPPINYGKIRLNYLEVPIYLSLLAYPKEGYLQKHFNFGVSYVRLLDTTIQDEIGNDVSNQVIWKRKQTLSGHIGVAHYFNANLGLDFRAALAKNTVGWAWTLGFRGIYLL